MVQGVHGQTIVFTSYQQVRHLLLAGGWPSIGTASEHGGRDVKLQGTRPRRFRMRTTNLREKGKTISSSLELHDSERLVSPLIRVELSFAPDGANTRISLRGATVRDLAPASSMQTAMSRGLANEYSRALLDQMAKAIEKLSANGSPASRPRAAAVVHGRIGSKT